MPFDRGLSFAAALLVLVSLGDASAQTYTEDAAIPTGAKGEVWPLSGQVLDLKVTVLPLKGVVTPLGGRIDPVQAALKDLGAKVEGKEIKIALSADSAKLLTVRVAALVVAEPQALVKTAR